MSELKISKTSFEKYHIPEDDREYILGVDEADSKILSEEDRDALFDKVQQNEWIGYAYYSISPSDISNFMLQKNKYNLNEIAHDTTIHLINKVFGKLKIKKIIVDTVGPAEKYQEKLKKIFDTDILVTKKADSLYPIVSCASIVAKVTRDATLKTMFENHSNFGSGYPSDPNTKQWLAENVDPVFGYPNTVRFSWSTCETILESKGVSVVWEKEIEPTKKRGVFYDSIGLKY
ncbi:Ribonuclease H2 subunit A [Boothiomyces macroporosus]|uniref:Ribonuclease n=1 Tax=Boothiomyces macroporosus TaxID=261099 RepID=A0AAD5UI30_9FUNG|nr:Ribonuclease H2 subunit A [Boothiomyces macroporosus]